MKKITRSYRKILLEVIAALALGSSAFAQVPQKFLTVGPKTNDNKGIKFNRNSSTPPQIRWNEGGSVLQFSNDGSTFFSIPSTAINLAVTTKTTNYTVTTNDDVVLGDATGGGFTLTLPSASGNSGKVLYLLKIDSTTNVVTISGTVDGVTNPTLTVIGQTTQIISDGTVWRTSNHKSKGLVSKTANYTLLLTDEVATVDASGGAFTITLPSAASAFGRTFTITRTDNTIANAVTISGTISGASDWKLFTQDETLTIYSNGTEYKVLNHYAQTPWYSAGTTTITGTTSNPTKASSVVTDTVYWRRLGNTAEIWFVYKHTNATGSANGSGDYLFAQPSGLTIDTTTVVLYSTVLGVSSPSPTNNLGIGNATNATTNSLGTISAYDTTHVRILPHGSTANGSVASSNFSITGSTIVYGGVYKAPIVNWKQ